MNDQKTDNNKSSFNINANNANKYDVIVIGSGMTGGWSAKEFTEVGFKTLMLERGRNVEHIRDYTTANMEPWTDPQGMVVDPKELEGRPVFANKGGKNKATNHLFVKDDEHPYIQKKPFAWVRGYQVGGKSLMWARMVQRWSDLDFEANARDGHGIDWPIRYKDIAPWYSYVEKFIGVINRMNAVIEKKTHRRKKKVRHFLSLLTP